jgi:hypothetical protein
VGNPREFLQAKRRTGDGRSQGRQAIRNGRLRGPLDLEGFLLVAAIFPGRSIGKIELFKPVFNTSKT